MGHKVSPRRAERGKRKVSLSSGSSEREDAAPPETVRNKPKPDTGKARSRSRSGARDDESYTYETTPEEERKESQSQKEAKVKAADPRDVRDKDRHSSSHLSQAEEKVKNPRDSNRSKKQDEQEEGMNCPICNKWLKNRYEAWKSHQKTSVRCATRRGEADTRKECRKCGKWVANNHYSWEQHKSSCKPDRLVLRDNRDKGCHLADRDDRDRYRGQRRQDDQVSRRSNPAQRQEGRWELRSRSPASSPQPIARYGHLPPPEPAQPPAHAMVSMHWHQRMTQQGAASSASWQQNWGENRDNHGPSSDADPSSASSRSVVQPLTALLLGITGILQHQR